MIGQCGTSRAHAEFTPAHLTLGANRAVDGRRGAGRRPQIHLGRQLGPDGGEMSQEAAKAVVGICNQRGLHARASAKFVKLASTFDAEVHVTRDGVTVNALSILVLLFYKIDKDTHERNVATLDAAASLAE